MSVGIDVPHDSSLGHVTGKSIFIDDRPLVSREVFVGLVTAPLACGKLIEVNASRAWNHPDFLGFFQAKDLKSNRWGAIVHDQPIIVDEKISYMNEVLAIFASTRRESMEEIKKLIDVRVEEEKGIFTIEEAKQQNSLLYHSAAPFRQGHPEKAIEEAPHCLKGKFVCGGQEHFYLESQAAIAYPLENDQIEIHSSSQHPSETQRLVAEALGLSLHQVVCIVKRMGGGFGGKESQAGPIACYAALVAARLGRPARIVLTKDEDMKITGKRHPFENDYEVGFDCDGKILGLNISLNADGGAYTDLSPSILERAMFHSDGAYYLQNCHIEGKCFRTNNHPNTAFRGFGGPQGTMTIESILEDIAHFLKKDAYQIRRLNIYQEKNILTPYGQEVQNNMLPKLFDSLYLSSRYQERLNKIKIHNQKRSGSVRGISITATKFGIAFTARFLNQGNALVNIHLDATIQVSTGATEMGQGVNTKIQQIVANAFGIQCHAVKIMTTSTEKNHNTSPTAASSGSDINGAAALLASDRIKARLTHLAKKIFLEEVQDDLNEIDGESDYSNQDIIFKNGQIIQKSTGKNMAFSKLVTSAYFNRISLGEYAHYKTPQLGFSKTLVQGNAFSYFTQGVAISEVLIDEYTGGTKVLQTDILMDLGRPLNPGIDRGQVSGAFIQGMGWVTTENLYYDEKRNLLSHSPTTYKIPNIQDIPRKFTIDFLENDCNEINVHRSKAVGEPPFLLGISVWTAIKHALSFRCKSRVIELPSPAMNEAILNELSKGRP